jgi:hypothetical protein
MNCLAPVGTIAFLASSVLATLKLSILNPLKKHFAQYQLSLLDLSPGFHSIHHGSRLKASDSPAGREKETRKEALGSDLHDSPPPLIIHGQ